MVDFKKFTGEQTYDQTLIPQAKDGSHVPVVPVADPLSTTTDKALGTQQFKRADGEESIASGQYKFPADVGEYHIPDYVSFYFLDLTTPDGDWVNAGKGYSIEGKMAQASKQAGLRAGNADKITKVIKSGGELGAAIIKTGTDATAAGVDYASKEAGDKIRAAGAAGANYLQSDPLGVGDTYKLTGDVVKMMMPSSVQFNDGAGWQAVDANPTMLGMIANIGLTDTTFAEVGTFEINKWVTSVLYDQGAKVAETMSKKVFNPYVSQAFESMQRRQFRFDWLVTPKNQGELDNVKKIIQLFRYHMHPSLEATKTFLRYPSQVDIKFFVDSGASENTWLPKVTTCIIKDFATNYTPNGQWTTSNAITGGAPYQFQLSLSVEEIVPLVKQDIMEGY